MNNPFSNSNKYAATYVRWTQAGAKQGYRPTHHAASASAAQFTTTRRLAESAANTPAAHGNKPAERRTCRAYVR